MFIDHTHSSKQFTASELLALARSGRVYTSALPLDERGNSSIHPFPFVVMAGNFFDLSHPCDTWLVNAQGMKDSRTPPGLIPRLVGAMFELDFSTSALRQAFMDYARQRQFFMVFKPSAESMLHLIGVGKTVDGATFDAINRLQVEMEALKYLENEEGLKQFHSLLMSGGAYISSKFEGELPFDVPWLKLDCLQDNDPKTHHQSLDASTSRSQRFRHQRAQSTELRQMRGA